MTALNVTKNDDGQFVITNPSGEVVSGPHETNSAAWKALDRLDGSERPEKAKSNKAVLWGKPEKKGSRSKKQEAKREAGLKTNAAKAPKWIRGMATGKFDPAGKRAYRDSQLGTFGAASEVRRIDPAVYLAEKAAKGEQ